MRAEIGIIGGSGFYEFLANPQRVEVDTPFGPPSAPVSVGEVDGRMVAFVPRHGEQHQFPPHKVNYRANMWALRSVGVRQVLTPCAVGSLRAELTPGTFVVPDQLVDRTWGRPHTVYDQVGKVVHVSLADPYCPRGRRTVLDSAAADTNLVDGGTLVVIQGPRFSTRAESLWHAAAGWSVVGMTGAPETPIARELAMCVTTIAMVTDMDAGLEAGEGVQHLDVLKVFADNIERLKALLLRVIANLPPTEDDAAATCACRRALDGQELPFPLP